MIKFIPFLFLMFISTISNGQRIDSLIVGSGGGFTGQITIYKIVKNKIYKGKGVVEIKYSEMSDITSKDVKSIQKGTKKILKKNNSSNHPSNTYRFIKIYSTNKKTEIVWGDPSFLNPKEIQEYYDNINKIITKLTFVSK